jgi:tetratricopeptide (TPR) repeat protein
VTNDAIEASHQANELTRNANFSDLHTLACLYAAQGKAAEARQVILQGITTANMAEPNSAAWYLFGSIYENYGIQDAAIAAYQKVEKPVSVVSPVDTRVLAQ